MADRRALGRGRGARDRGVAFGVVLLVWAVLASSPATLADEWRFDPPIEGVHLGIRGQVREGVFVISEVTFGGAAARAGVHAKDQIVSIAGASGFADFDAFRDVVSALSSGQAGRVTIRRRGATREIELVPDHAAFRDFFDVVRLVERSRFLRGLDSMPAALDTIRSEDAMRLREATRWSRVYEVLNEAVGRLGVSHAAVMSSWAHRSLVEAARKGEGAFRLGLLLAVAGGDVPRTFVIETLDGAPAARAGLRVGDEIVRVNGIDALKTPRRVLAGYEAHHPYFVIAVDPHETVALEVRSTRGGPARRVEVAIDEASDELAATVASFGTFECEGRIVAVGHLRSFLFPGLPEIVERALGHGDTGAAEGWILDLRGRGGRVDVLEKLLRLFSRDERPRVLLIDRNTRSAKEVFAARLRGDSWTRLVGERTAGAVLPTWFHPLSRGAAVMLPDNPRSLRKVLGNTRLEGAGVVPDVEVDVEIEYSQGADPIFETGMSELLGMLEGRPRRRRF